MNKLLVVFIQILMLFSFASYADENEPLTQEKKASIEELMQIVGITDIEKQMASVFVAQNVKEIKETHRDIPDRMFSVLEQEVNDVIKSQIEANGGFSEKVVPIYHKYFTHEEVKGLIKFYQTDLGKKITTALPDIMRESIQIGQEWGYSLEPLIQERVSKRFKEEGFELK